MAIDVIRAACADISDSYTTRDTGRGGNVALALDLVGTGPASGGNVAGDLLNRLRMAGLDVVTPGGREPTWQHLLGGGCVTVRCLPEMPTQELAVRRHGSPVGITAAQWRGRLTAAARWARRQGLAPVDGRSPRLWPRAATLAALAAEGGSGNRTRRVRVGDSGWPGCAMTERLS
jgi:hypothetical protein